MTNRDEVYTHGHHASVLRSHRWRTAKNSAGYLLPYLATGQSLLDVGCGPGTITADLARLVAPGRVVGVDTEQALAQHDHTGADEPDNLGFEVGDAYQLGYPDGSFDIVHAHQLLQHLADPVAALVEMRRVCAPGGRVAARDADYQAMTWYPSAPRLDRWLTLYEAVARGNHAEPDAGRRLRAWALQAGFAEVTSTASAWCYADTQDRHWWADLWAERVEASALAEQALDRGLATRTQLAEIAQGWRDWAAHEDGWFAVLNSEIICPAGSEPAD
jgi:ubiquinone/menaquinone biosynthesis C-methylase UbiE